MLLTAKHCMTHLRVWALTIAVLSAGYAVADPVVIVSSKSPITTASPEDVSNLFLGKASNVHGTSATPVALKDGNATRDAFVTKFTGKDPSQFKSHWAKMVFTGRVQQMKEFDSDAAIKAAVAADPALVGMIDSASVDGTVKVIAK